MWQANWQVFHTLILKQAGTGNCEIFKYCEIFKVSDLSQIKFEKDFIHLFYILENSKHFFILFFKILKIKKIKDKLSK